LENANINVELVVKSKDINIIRHHLVPKHIILRERQVKELLERYGIVTQQLPRIHDSDPVVKTVGAKIGNVLKIVRKSSTAGETSYYRLVVKG